MFNESSFFEAPPEETPLENKEENYVEQTEHQQHMKEMDEKDNEARPEIEKKFKDALNLLHTKIQSSMESENNFPSDKILEQLLEDIPLFAKMEIMAKKMIIGSLQKEEEFRSPDPEVFTEKGIEVLGLFINLAAIKVGGEAWLREKAKEKSREA